MKRIVTFAAIAGIAFTAQAADPSFYDNERINSTLAPLGEMEALDESQGTGADAQSARAAAEELANRNAIRAAARDAVHYDDAILRAARQMTEARNPLTTGYGPTVDQDWGIDSAPSATHNPLTTGFGPAV